MIKNVTKRTIIVEKFKFAESFSDRFLGLLKPSNPRALIFKTRFGIHTFFMKAPIDVLILDNKNKIVQIEKNLKPWRVYFWNPRFEKVIELPGASVGDSKTKIGDLISFY